MDNISSQHIVHAGWLMKSPPEKRLWKTKWRRRWFILKFSGQIPGQYVLEYYVDQTCKKLKGTIDLDQCEQVDAGLQLEIRKENYEHMFDLRTTKRTYFLVAKDEEEMNKWVECICAVCGLKMEMIQSDVSLLPSVDLNEERYSPQPSQAEQHQQSTSDSSLSTLNYIPISECYTGKPQSPPPPRPPKPRAIQLAKSQSSLVLCPYEQSDQSSKMTPVSNASTLKTMPSAVLVNDRPLYLNSMPNQSLNIYDTWHSGSMNKMASIIDRVNMFPPPQVNRELKPHRRYNMDSNSDMRIQSMSLSRNKHQRLPAVTTTYTLRNNEDKSMHKPHLSHVQSELTKMQFMMPQAKQSLDNNNVNEIQYLDLDLDSDSTNSQSPRTPQDSHSINNSGQTDSTAFPGWSIPYSTNGNTFNNNNNINHVNNNNNNNNNPNTVYKQVDFVKTQALYKMRHNVDLYRNSS